MVRVRIKELMESGAHFGHQTRKWNPKMKRYIFDRRNGIHIINLELTAPLLEKACEFVREISSQGGKVLFVGTKPHAQKAICETAQELQMPYVSSRWLGGMLTNMATIRKSVGKLENIEKMEEDGSLDVLTKKEKSGILKIKAKLKRNLAGVQKMNNLPNAVFVVDPQKETNGVLEARKLKIPIIAMVDTNCNPDLIDYCIPSNDDAIRTIKFVLDKIKSAVGEGNTLWLKKEEERKAREAEARAAEEARKAELKKKAEESQKARKVAEEEKKAEVDSIIADLEKNKD